MRLRIIGLCEAYGRRQTPGSEAATHAARMLALYRRCYARLTGREATAAEVAAAMWRRYTDMHAAVTNSAPPGHNCHAKVRPCPYNKGTTREHRTQGTPHRVYRVDQRQPTHKQVGDLAAAIERAARDGQRLEAVIRRPEFGELTLDCGNPGRKNDSQDSRGHGVQHALEERHNIGPRAIAETLLLGVVKPHEYKKSRLTIRHAGNEVIIEREIRKGSGRISSTHAKLHTAMKKE